MNPYIPICFVILLINTSIKQVREITATYTRREFKWKADAILALQEMAECYLVGLFEDA